MILTRHRRLDTAARSALVAMGCLLWHMGSNVTPVGAQVPTTGAVVRIERPIPFDSAKRILVMTPTVAARLKLSGPDWPLRTDWNEARLYTLDTTATSEVVLVAQRVDGAVARYVLSRSELSRLSNMINMALVAQGPANEEARGGTTMVLSEPAGNAFVRNQTTLGLFAYGPATAAIFNESSGAAAGGAYFLAAGTSFFVAAQMIRHASITRAQTILTFHGGTRGSAMGAAIANIADANGGAGYGIPILVGALGGSVAGFKGARGMSDGEAASSGFIADMFALTTLGVSGSLGAFRGPKAEFVDGMYTEEKAPNSGRRIALSAAIGAGLAGYVIGPRYARRSAYNVTAGDIDVAFASAILGGTLANALVGNDAHETTRYGVMTGGMLLGALAADRTKVRHADRTPSDGTLIQLGAFAGALMGGGVAVMTEANERASALLVGLGGIGGLALADALVGPARDAGPKRGVLPSDGSYSSNTSSRVSLSIVPVATALALRSQRRGDIRIPITERPTIHNMPVMRIAF